MNPSLILDLPALPGPNHDGGKLVIGPDHYLYAVIGDLNHRGKLQNVSIFTIIALETFTYLVRCVAPIHFYAT